jgi:DNA repair protein RecO (recombination protein O)
MTHKTKGIVLRSVKYGETSLVVTMYTELFGLQSYMVNGARSMSKKGGSKLQFFQPAALLELEVYHNDLKNLQRIRDVQWAHLYEHMYFDVVRNAVALFMVELLNRSLKQPESNADLFYFMEDALLHLDRSNAIVTANFPLFFSIHLSNFFGFRIEDEYDEAHPILDLIEGRFVSETPTHEHYLDGALSAATSQLLQVMQPAELSDVLLNKDTRRILLQAYQTIYAVNISDFGQLRSLPVLQEVLG